MDITQINTLLHQGITTAPGLLPHVESLQDSPFIFNFDFGLNQLPEEPGLLLIRGPRQYGKSTWLELEIQKTVASFGPASAFYLNGDEIRDPEALTQKIEELIPLFRKEAKVKRLFIDEITAIESWESSLKRLIDRGMLNQVLLVSTGSKATDLRRGAERLPGRKGKLARTNYLFTPISYSEFKSKCGSIFKSKTLTAYMMTAGCPVACSEMAQHKKIPEHVITMVKDWVYGECSATGRDRSSLLSVMEVLERQGGIQVGQSKLAREAGLANNTVAAGYIELLGDLLTVAPSYAWDPSHKIYLKRKPSKFHFINLLVALAWEPTKPRTIDDFENLLGEEKAKFYEWLVAQEIWRRQAIQGEEIPEHLGFWKSDHHELDFVMDPNNFIEVKSGTPSPLEFTWFPKIFPKAHLRVINQKAFSGLSVEGISFEDFLTA